MSRMSPEYRPTSPEEQVEFLRERGMTINNRPLATRSLRFVSYYRLRAYWLAFEKSPGRYKPGTAFEHGLNLYFFDRELRLLVLDATERVEVALRARWEQRMSRAYGHYGYLDDEDIYSNTGRLYRSIGRLKDDYSKYKKDLKEHYQKKYDQLNPDRPIVWMAAERMSFRNLIDWIGNLKHTKDRREVSRHLPIDETEFVSLMHHLADVRNICAHHDRLWDRDIESIRARKALKRLEDSMSDDNKNRLYNTLVLLCHLLDTIEPEGARRWRKQVIALIDRYQSPALAGSAEPQEEWLGRSAGLSKNWMPDRMGFPEDWRGRPIWSICNAQ